VDTTTPNFSTPEEVARRYHRSKSTLRQWRRIGYGPEGVRVGGRILYAEVELLQFEQTLGLASYATLNTR